MSDVVFIEGIKFHGFHGLTRHERQIGVRLSVDVTIETDLARAGRSDRVGDTVNYQKVHARIVELGRGRSHRLLESFAATVMEALLSDFPTIARVTLRVRKETPVLDGIVDSVGVQMSRGREGA